MGRDGAPNERGTAAVEMALLLPVLVLVLLSILELGRVLDAWVVATNAAREGARYAAYGESAQTVRDKVGVYLTKGLGGRTDVNPPASGEITVTNAQGTPGSAVQVAVPLKVRVFSPWAKGLGLPDPVVVVGAVTMRLQ